MTKLFTILISLQLFSCSETKKSDKSKEKVLSESELNAEAQRAVDSAIAVIDEQVRNEIVADTARLATAPVQVLKYNLVKKEYSNFRDIELKYKNVSGKTITGIRFEWFGTNAFGEPADLGSYGNDGRGNGFTDETLKAGKTSYGIWNIMSRDAKKISSARAYEVVFSDGTKWTLR